MIVLMKIDIGIFRMRKYSTEQPLIEIEAAHERLANTDPFGYVAILKSEKIRAEKK